MSADDYAARHLSKRKQLEFIATHNPHEVETVSYHLWNAGFYLDQADAALDPKRSTVILVSFILFAVATISGVASVVIRIILAVQS